MATAKIIELDETNICKLCNNALGKYTCPRCTLLYCSLTCYQSDAHLSCSESFYEECVSKELTNESESDAKAKMLEILSRMHDEENLNQSEEKLLDSDDDDECLDLGERLAGIDLNDPEQVWERLNSDERQEFEAFLRSGDVSKYIAQWQPWWMKRFDKTVLEVEEFNKHKETCPEVTMSIIKDFNEICTVAPSDCVRYNLINILAAYAFVMRYFNGEPADYPKESVACTVTLSLTLKSNHNFDSFENAVVSVQQECLSTSWIETDEENIELMKEDVHRILQGPHSTERKMYILSALCDLRRLLEASLTPSCSKDEKRGDFSRVFPESRFPEIQLEPKHKVKKLIKKLDYFLSYTRSCFTD